MRSSFLLGLMGTNVDEAFSNIRKLYTRRNFIVHGSGIDTDFKIDSFLTQYSRRCIIAMLILCNNYFDTSPDKIKKKIVNEIDLAMLDVVKRENLKKQLDEGLKDFRLSIPRMFEGKDWKIGW